MVSGAGRSFSTRPGGRMPRRPAVCVRSARRQEQRGRQTRRARPRPLARASQSPAALAHTCSGPSAPSGPPAHPPSCDADARPRSLGPGGARQARRRATAGSGRPARSRPMRGCPSATEGGAWRSASVAPAMRQARLPPTRAARRRARPDPHPAAWCQAPPTSAAEIDRVANGLGTGAGQAEMTTQRFAVVVITGQREDRRPQRRQHFAHLLVLNVAAAVREIAGHQHGIRLWTHRAHAPHRCRERRDGIAIGPVSSDVRIAELHDQKWRSHGGIMTRPGDRPLPVTRCRGGLRS